jgi:hypothetical protein
MVWGSVPDGTALYAHSEALTRLRAECLWLRQQSQAARTTLAQLQAERVRWLALARRALQRP